MRIGVDVRVLLDKNYSGVANFTYCLLANLLSSDQKNEYYFWANSFSGRPQLDFNPPPEKIKVDSYPNKLFNYALQKMLAWPKLDRQLGGVDLLYLPHINFASFSKKCGRIITVHDLSFLRYPDLFSARKNLWHWALNLKKNINNFDRVIAVSQNTKNDLIDLLSLEAEKVEVIYPGLPINSSAGGENDPSWPRKYLAKNYQIDSDFILYVGTIEPRKNISGLIAAYNSLRDDGFDLRLVLAGGWGWRTEGIKKAWRDSKYRDDIRFIGYVDDQSKSFLYQTARVLAYPSFYEGFGFPPLEAMSYGLPVVSSNVSSLPEVLGSSAILVDPDRPADLAEALKSVLSDKVWREELIKAGRKQAANFSWTETTKKYLAVFEKYARN